MSSSLPDSTSSVYNALACELSAWPQIPTVPDHVWHRILSQMPLKDFAKVCCVSSSLTVTGSAWEQLRSLMVWSAKVRNLWYNITQIRAAIHKHWRVARDKWRYGGTLTYSSYMGTLNDLATICDMARRRASRIGKIIKPLKQSFQQLCDELDSVLSQYPQSDPRLVAFEIDIEDVRKAFLASGSDCQYGFAVSCSDEA